MNNYKLQGWLRPFHSKVIRVVTLKGELLNRGASSELSSRSLQSFSTIAGLLFKELICLFCQF